MPTDDAQDRATEFLKELYAAGSIDAGQLETGVAGVLAARTEAELAGVVRSLPAPVAFTSPDRRLDPPLPGLPLIRLDVTAMIGRVHLRHPGTPRRTRRWRRARTA